MGDFTVDEVDLARNFGFDITMSGGNMGMPAAAHKDYLVRCNFLYKEFLSNMNILIKEEKDIKKSLKELHKEKINNLRFSLYRCQNANQNHDPFARQQEPFISPSVWESRGNTPWESRGNTPWDTRGLEPILDVAEDNLVRPQTAPVGPAIDDTQNVIEPDSRPKTTGAVRPHGNNKTTPGKAASAISQTSTVVGVLDPSSERTSDRKITVSKHSFEKVIRPTKISLKHRDGKFLVKPMKDNFVNDQGDNVAFDPANAYKKYDPVNEKLALVRQITSYKTPTIASDMKINNRVPIQKTLRGEDAKRITVAEIYRNARDRKTRHFKLIARKSAKDKANEESSEALHGNLLSVNSRPFSRKDRNVNTNREELRSRSRANTRLTFRENTPVDSHQTPLSPNHDLAKSTDSGTFRSLMKRGKPVDNVDSQIGLESVETDSARNSGLLRVASVRTNSRTVSVNESNSKSRGENNEDRGNTDTGVKRPRAQRVSEISKATEISAAYQNGGQNDATKQADGKHVSMAPARGRRASIVSIVSAGSFIVKLKNAVNNNKDKPADEAKLSFRPPPRVESITDSSRIVKQQMRKDRQLDERMAVWKRRMVNAGSIGRPIKRTGRLKLI